MLADNSVYNCIFVELQDLAGNPARAQTGTTISLSSSLITIGNVDSTVTIARGSTYAVANFFSTYTPGTTTIAATASGYATVQTTITSVGPVPSRLALFGFPPVLPADGNSYNAMVVQLQDAGGSPAKAPLGGIQVTLSSSDSRIASVPSSVAISGGQTYAVASVTTTNGAEGSATITAISSNYTSTQTSIRTQNTSISTPTSLVLYVAPQRTLADNSAHPQIIAELQNAAGRITQSATSIVVTLSSSDETIGKVQQTIAIPASAVYANATFTSTYKAGTTTITAVATNLASATQTVTTIGPVPSRLAVFTVPSTLPADNKAYNAIIVQLQDNQGLPAQDPNGDVTVSLFSSTPNVGTVTPTLKIPYGKTYATATFTATYLPNPTTITAQAPGYTTGQATMTTYLVDQASLFVTITATPISVVSGAQTNITTQVTIDGKNPALGAIVKFDSSNGGTFAATSDLGNGIYQTMFTTPNINIKTNCTITATVSKTGYSDTPATIQIVLISAVSVGTIQILVQDDKGVAQKDVVVSSTVQPTGMGTLVGVTNTSGYVAFPSATIGVYNFTVNKIGYKIANQTINFTTNQASIPVVTITKTGTAQQPMDLTYVFLIIVAAAVVVVIIAAAYVQRRKTAAKFKVPKKWAPPPPPPKSRS